MLTCSRCRAQVPDAEALIAHLEAHMAAQDPSDPAGKPVDGLNDVLERNSRDPNTRATPGQFGIL